MRITARRAFHRVGANSGTIVKRTYLEQNRPPAGPPPRPPGPATWHQLERVHAPFYRFLYSETGKDYRWTDRADWDDAEILSHLARPEVAVFWLQAEGTVAGWCELERHQDEVQVAYFGLMPPFVGKGWGRFWLDWTIRKAWQPAPKRVWVHTCDQDHPAALPLYKKLEFVPYKTESV